MTEIQSWLPGYLEAVDVSGQVCWAGDGWVHASPQLKAFCVGCHPPQTKELPGASIKLAGKNDVLVVPRPLSSHEFEWAVLGIELKVPKEFKEQALRQAQAEFLLFASRSRLPFVQVSIGNETPPTLLLLMNVRSVTCCALPHYRWLLISIGGR